MKTYKLIVYSENFKKDYEVLATKLIIAKELVKNDFMKMFPNENYYKVALEPTDLKNHLEEFLNILYEGDVKDESNRYSLQ